MILIPVQVLCDFYTYSKGHLVRGFKGQILEFDADLVSHLESGGMVEAIVDEDEIEEEIEE